jgi:integrase
VTAEREAADEADRVRDEQIAELRATPARRTGLPAPRGPVLSHEQSVEDWARTRGLIPDDQPLSFDRYLKGLPTGNWEGAEHERALTGVEGAKLTGTYVDPTRSRVTLGAWADMWIDAQADLSPTTRNRYEGIIRTHIRPRWASVRLSDVSHADVQRWVTGLSVAPASARKVHRVLSMMLAWAVADDRLARNPADKISLPRVAHAEKRFLTHAQVAELADACGEEYRTMVLFLAYTGLRWGEMAALRVGRVDFLRRRVLVAESVTPVKGVMTFGPTKGHERREVPVPRFLVDDLSRHVAGRSAEELLFTGARGAVMR